MPASWKKTKTPGIYKRTLKSGEVRYVVIVRDRSGRQRKLTHRTLAEAREAKADYASSVDRVIWRQTWRDRTYDRRGLPRRP